MNSIPFVENHPDDMHCVSAVFRMIHQYYFGYDLSWGQIDELMKATAGKATWTFVGETEFAKKGLAVKNIEPLDYEKLHMEGMEYLKSIMNEDVYRYHQTKSNIQSVIPHIPAYLKHVTHETRKTLTKELIGELKKGNLVAVEVNARILNDLPGFNLHMVLLYGYDGKHIFLHDPGLPPRKARKVSVKKFEQCFNFMGANGAVTIFSGNSFHETSTTGKTN